MPENSTYQQLLQVLTELVDSRRSGVLYIHSDCNHAISFALDKGRIYAIFFGPKRGMKALPRINSISGGSYRFEAGAFNGIAHALPATPQILNLLRTQDCGSEISRHAMGVGVEPASGISKQKRELIVLQLRQYLAEYLGPISNLVFDDTLEEAGDFGASPESIIDLVAKLCTDIPSGREAEQFKQRAFTAIKHIIES